MPTEREVRPELRNLKFIANEVQGIIEDTYGLHGSDFVRAQDFLFPEIQNDHTRRLLRRQRRKEFERIIPYGIFMFDELASGQFETRNPVIFLNILVRENLKDIPTLLDVFTSALQEDHHQGSRNLYEEGESKTLGLLTVIEETSHFMHVQMNVKLGSKPHEGIGEGMALLDFDRVINALVNQGITSGKFLPDGKEVQMAREMVNEKVKHYAESKYSAHGMIAELMGKFIYAINDEEARGRDVKEVLRQLYQTPDDAKITYLYRYLSKYRLRRRLRKIKSLVTF